jgi:MFS transporter, DHA2 family, multidrug resistance protein
MLVVSKLIKKTDPRRLITVGIILMTIGCYAGVYYSFDIDPWWIMWPLFVQGFGMGMIFVPLSAIAFSTLPDRSRAEAAGLFSLLRTLGSSVGISLVINFYIRHTQIAWNQMGGMITPYNPAVAQFLKPLHLSLNHPLAGSILGYTLGEQAQMLAVVNTFAFIAWSMALMLPLVLLFKRK